LYLYFVFVFCILYLCINFQTSVASFAIGATSGTLLSLNPDPQKHAVGLFILFFSFVQLFEALIYKGFDRKGLVSKLLLLNLALQGVVFFFLVNSFGLLFALCCAVALLVGSAVFFKNFKRAVLNPCLNWAFVDWMSMLLLWGMYISILFFLLTSTALFYRKIGYILLFTLVVPYVVLPIQMYRSPSIWCLTSALVSPVTLFL